MYNYAEGTLDHVDDKIVQIEGVLDLLECKLSSIPADAISEVPTSAVQPSSTGQSAVPPPDMAVPVPPPAGVNAPQLPSRVEPEAKKSPEEEKEKLRAELYKDENVKTFAKMLKFGLPDGAIITKMKAMGYDASLLDVFLPKTNACVENRSYRGQTKRRLICSLCLHSIIPRCTSRLVSYQ